MTTAIKSYRSPIDKRTRSNPVVVTGIHRSGSTWVGNVLSKSSTVKYIHEPFNGICPSGVCTADFPYTYMHVNEENEEAFYPALSDMFQLKYSLPAGLSAADSPASYLRLVKHYTSSLNDRLRNKTPLVKDPMAVLSAEWLAQEFDATILILVRHPAAFVSSCYQLGWGFHFKHFMNQPILMDTYFLPFAAEIKEYTDGSHNLIERLSFLWKLIYSVVADYRQRHPDWLIVRYEDICSDPTASFENILHYCNLEKTAKVSAFIEESTGATQPKDILNNIHSIKRDTRKQIDVWKQRLPQTDVDFIRSRVESVSSAFYTDADW